LTPKVELLKVLPSEGVAMGEIGALLEVGLASGETGAPVGLAGGEMGALPGVAEGTAGTGVALGGGAGAGS
jgi:hypothetical protein